MTSQKFCLASSEIKFTGILSYDSDVGRMSYPIPGIKSSLVASRNIFRVSAGLVIFQSAHLTSLVTIILLVSGLYNLYLSLVRLHEYPTMIDLNILYVIWFLKFYRLVTYPIRPNSKNKPTIFGFSPYMVLNGLVLLPVAAILFLTRSHVWTSSAHRFFWDVSLSLVFNSIANAPSLMTENILSMTLFSWGMCGMVYPNATFSFSHAFCNFDWRYPAFSQQRYLTGIPHDFIFLKNSPIFFGSCDVVFVKKLQE